MITEAAIFPLARVGSHADRQRVGARVSDGYAPSNGCILDIVSDGQYPGPPDDVWKRTALAQRAWWIEAASIH